MTSFVTYYAREGRGAIKPTGSSRMGGAAAGGRTMVRSTASAGSYGVVDRKSETEKGMTMAKSERTRLLTPTFRVSFPDVFVKRIFQGEKSGCYACTALFSGFEVKDDCTVFKTPASWSEQDQAKWQAIIAACNNVSIEAFKKPTKDLDREVYELPFHRGEETDYEGYGPGVVYFTMSAKKRRPGIIARMVSRRSRKLVRRNSTPAATPRASVIPFANIQCKTLSLGMNNLQKLANGARLELLRLRKPNISRP